MPLFLAAALAAAPAPPAPPDASETPSDTDADGLPRFHLDIDVVTPENVEVALDKAAPSTTVIGPAEIRAAGVVLVADLLRRVAGVDLSRAGTAGRVATVRVDGASSAQTLVLVNGMEVNSPTLGLADLSDLTVDDVERIEIVRGPLSALYGSQAMGGVVNVVTRRGRGKPTFSALAEGGSFGAWRGAVETQGGAGDRAGYTFALSRTDLDGRTFDAPQVGKVRNDHYDNTTVAGSFHAALGKATSVAFDGRYADAERGIPIEAFGTQVFDINSTQADRAGVVSGELRTKLGERVTPHVRAGWSGGHEDFDDPLDPGEDGPFASDVHSRTRTGLTEVNAAADLHLAAHDVLTAGLEWQRRKGELDDNFGDHFDRRFDTTGYFAENRLELPSLLAEGDDLVVSAGLRVDDAESFGTTVNPKLQALWTAPGGRWRARGGAGRGFRAPSLNELYFPFFGNPDLEPEVSRTYEGAFGLRALDGKLDAEVRAFHSDFDDLIATDPDTFTAVNLARARVNGAQLEVRAVPTTPLWIRGSFTWQQAEDARTGERLLRRPRVKGGVSLGYERARRWRLGVDLTAIGAQRDVRIAGFPQENPGWARVDVAGAWTLPFAARRLELFGRVENLFDKEYSEQTAFPAPGINASGGVRARF